MSHLRHPVMLAIVDATVLATDCAPVTVSNDFIDSNKAFAIGGDKEIFTVSDHVVNAVKSTYTVRTHIVKQKNYSCYVVSFITAVGKIVSDAICNEAGKSVKQVTRISRQLGNALLKAAGKSQ